MSDAADTSRSMLEGRLRFEALLADLSSEFVNLDASLIDTAIEDALRRIAELLNLDRGALAQLEADTLRFTHYWARDGFPVSLVSVDAAEVYPLAFERIMASESYCFSSVDELPAGVADRERVSQSGTKSIVALPLRAGARVIGGVAFSATREERPWDPAIVGRLRLIADVFAGALARKRAAADLAAAVDDRMRFEGLVSDLASQFVNLDSDLVDGAIEDAQRRLVEALDLDRSALCRIESDGRVVLTHYWSRPEFPPLHVERGAVVTEFPWLFGRVRNGEVVCTSSVDDLPPNVPDREHMAEFGALSNVTVPLLVSGRVIGAVMFGSLRRTRTWPAETVNRLALIGQVFAGALARKRAEVELRAAVEENARLRDRLLEENIYLQHEMRERHGPFEILGQSTAIRSLLTEVEQVASTSATVLLLGETGTGKELVATAIHERSTRSARPMVRVNCAAIPTALIESELFGREKGAFTGAVTPQAGRFELADGSTIFLDEIGELQVEVQVKLLRVLQERHIERLGGSRPIRVDVRVIAATNRDLEQMVADGTFREDLYYRLNVFPIRVPPLRERPEDIPALVWAFLDEFSRSFGRRIESIPKEHMLALQRYPWPGNVRELRNTVERAVIVSNGPRLAIAPPPVKVRTGHRALRLDDVERQHIVSVLERAGWRIRGPHGAAELLGLKPSTLEGRMARLQIHRPQP